MKEIPKTTVFIISLCIIGLIFLSYLSMTTGKEIPSAIIAVFSSVLSGVIGYEVGKGE